MPLSEETIARGESLLLRWLSPAAAIGFAGWMVVTRSLTPEGVALVLGLGVARPLAKRRDEPPAPPPPTAGSTGP